MTLFKNKYRIGSTRLKNWDYSSNGHYFITICTKNRKYYFGDIHDGEMKLSESGGIAEKYWLEIPLHFPNVELDSYIVMPNHVHGIVVINDDAVSDVETQNFASLRNEQSTNQFGPQSKNLASIIRGFKIGVKKYATMHDIQFAWQPRFYDHVVRNHKSLSRIRKYIIENPMKWKNDRNNQGNLYM